jgi:hypothetical protein
VGQGGGVDGDGAALGGFAAGGSDGWVLGKASVEESVGGNEWHGGGRD